MPSLFMERLGLFRETLEGVHIATIFIATVSSMTLFLVTCSAIYNLYFHPLKKYPGPFLARATGWWYIYQLHSGTQPFAIKAAHDKYGPVIRVAPNDLDYIHPEAWRDIFGHRYGVKENEKDQRHIIREGPNVDIISANKERHAALRRLMSNGFSDKALKEQQPTINKHIDLLIRKLREESEKDQEINIQDWYNFTTFDIIGDLAFSESFDCLTTSSYHPWVKLLGRYIRAATIIWTINRIGMGKSFLWNKVTPLIYRLSRRDHNALAHEKLLRRLEVEPKYTDLLQRMIGAYRSGKLSLGDLSVNSRSLVVAGSETSATLLTGATYFLGTHPSVLARLSAEVRQNFKSESDIDIATVTELPLLMAVLDETLRLFPPAGGTFARVTPPEGAKICGEWIPGRTSVGVTIYAMNYTQENWRDPESFRPERFSKGIVAHRSDKIKSLEIDEQNIEHEWSSDRKDALQPFSYGPRNCIGRNLAYIEMRIILARILWNFDVTLCPGNIACNKQKIYLVWEKNPLFVRLKSVKHYDTRVDIQTIQTASGKE